MRQTIHRWLGAAAILVPVGIVPAQPTDPGKVPPRVATLSVDFKGGPLREYIASLKKAASDEPVNVVISGNADVVLPPIALKGVAIEAAVGLLEHLDGSEHRVVVSLTGDRGAAPVFVVNTIVPRAVRGASGGDAPGAPMDLAVFSLRSILEVPPGTPGVPGTKADPAAVLTAVQTVLSMGGGPSSEMKYHQDTQALVIRGTPDQTGAVQRLLNALRDDLMRVRSAAVESQLRESQMAADIQRARVDIEAARMEANFAEQELAQVKVMADKGTLTAADVAKAELNFRRHQADVERAEIQLRSQAEQFEAWRRSRGAAGGGAMTPDELRQRIKEVESTLASLREELRKLEAAGAR